MSTAGTRLPEHEKLIQNPNIIVKIPQCGIQDFPVLLTFSFKAYKHVLILKKGFQSVQHVQSVQSFKKRAVAQQRFPKSPKCPTCPKWPKYTKVWHSMNACEWVTDMANPWDAYASKER